MRYAPVVISLGLVFSAEALANPVAMEVLRTRQVPHSTHVQITYAVDGQKPAVPQQTTRDGSPVGGDWTPMTADFTANTGSGLVSTQGIQLCDCSVPLGQHTYKVTVPNVYNGNLAQMQSTVTVVADLGDPQDAGVAGDVWPWDIPEPSQIQGLDCLAWCSGSTEADSAASPTDSATIPADSAASPTDSGPAPQRDTNTGTPDDGGSGSSGEVTDRGGCALSPMPRLSGLLVLLLLGLVVGIWRRTV